MGFWRLLLVIWLAGLWLVPAPVAAGGPVAGRYLTGVGNEIEIELVIAAPAPPLVIVIQNLPVGTKVAGSTPALTKYDPAKGEAKWLLNKVAPGRMIVSLRLERPVAKGEISGEIRYRNGAGEMVGIVLQN
jgi:hypothetical protein